MIQEKNVNLVRKRSSLQFSLNLPVLSAQFMTAPTGQASEMRNLPPADPPRPKMTREIELKFGSQQNFCLLPFFQPKIRN
jgi:hypothetical protein